MKSLKKKETSGSVHPYQFSKSYAPAYEDFKTYDKILPGNPNVIFYQGLSLEGIGRVSESADKYYRYLNIVNQGEKAEYAYQRLIKWGHIK